MRERPILFSAPMIRAIQADSKTVTRRTVKHAVQRIDGGIPYGEPGPRGSAVLRCPYGVRGDRIWVREAFRVASTYEHLPPRDIPANVEVEYYADGAAGHQLRGKQRPGMFMPRWASRILLEVTDVRVERLQDITREQAIAEGIEPVGNRWRHYFFPTEDGEAWEFPQNSYASLWDKLNGEGAWDSNPWVFAISFRRLTP